MANETKRRTVQVQDVVPGMKLAHQNFHFQVREVYMDQYGVNVENPVAESSFVIQTTHGTLQGPFKWDVQLEVEE